MNKVSIRRDDCQLSGFSSETDRQIPGLSNRIKRSINDGNLISDFADDIVG